MKIELDINSCKQCPFWKEGPYQSTDGFDHGYDWICTKANKTIAGFVEWHEVNKIKIPEWCPVKIK
jgi:hypothetical protein